MRKIAAGRSMNFLRNTRIAATPETGWTTAIFSPFHLHWSLKHNCASLNCKFAEYVLDFRREPSLKQAGVVRLGPRDLHGHHLVNLPRTRPRPGRSPRTLQHPGQPLVGQHGVRRPGSGVCCQLGPGLGVARDCAETPAIAPAPTAAVAAEVPDAVTQPRPNSVILAPS